MNETLTKAIMHRSKLRNIFLKNRTEENRKKLCQTEKLMCYTFAKE